MFDFFNNIIAFIASIGDVIINYFESMGGLFVILLSVPTFFSSMYFVPSPLTQAVMLSGGLALTFIILGRNLGGGR